MRATPPKQIANPRINAERDRTFPADSHQPNSFPMDSPRPESVLRDGDANNSARFFLKLRRPSPQSRTHAHSPIRVHPPTDRPALPIFGSYPFFRTQKYFLNKTSDSWLECQLFCLVVTFPSARCGEARRPAGDARRERRNHVADLHQSPGG